jgi:hypothetical protein
LQQLLKSLWITFLSGDAFNIIENPVGDKVTFLHHDPPTLQHKKDLLDNGKAHFCNCHLSQWASL